MSDHPGQPGRRFHGHGHRHHRGRRFGSRRATGKRHKPKSTRHQHHRRGRTAQTNNQPNEQTEDSQEQPQRLLEAKRSLELQIVNLEVQRQQVEMERDSRSRRYDDGEVTRYGAGESYRPFNSTTRRARSPQRERRSPPPTERARSPPREPRDRPRTPPREPRERARSPPREPRDRPRSPPREPRERPRSPPREPRARSPPPRIRPRSPPVLEDRYVPDRTPRRRSRSPFRPARSRDRGREDDRGLAAADTWRRPQRSRSPARRPSPRRSPVRRNSPPSRRFSPPPRRDIRDERDHRSFNSRDPRSYPQSHSVQTEVHTTFYGRDDANPNNIVINQSKRISQSPRTCNTSSSDFMQDYENSSRRIGVHRAAQFGPGQRQGHLASRAPGLMFSDANYASENYAAKQFHYRTPQSDPSFHVRANNVDTQFRGRSRSADRDRRDVRDRDRRSPPARRMSPAGARGGPYRRRSPSMDRRDDRYVSAPRRPSPPRESAVSSSYPSRDQSRRPSPLPSNGRQPERSNPQSPFSSRHQSRSPQRAPPPRERSPVRPTATEPPARSPPRGPAASRPPPTGPRNDRARRDFRDERETRVFSGRSGSVVNETSVRPAPGPSRQDATSPGGAPPAGPRGYAAPRGGFGRGAGRGNTWAAPVQSRNLSPAPGPASATPGSNNAPTPSGPRGLTPSSTSVPATPTMQSKPFNPPKGPAAEKRQLSVFEKEVATMTLIVPGGKMTVEDEAATKGILPEQLAHFKAAEDEADRIRREMEKNEEKTRAMMVDFRKGQRECEILKLRTDLTEAAMAKSSGDGFIGSAF